MARVEHDQSFGPPHAPQNVPPVRARQGRLGLPVLLVLAGGLILAAIAWFGAELYGDAITPPVSEQVGNPAAPSAGQPDSRSGGDAAPATQPPASQP